MRRRGVSSPLGFLACIRSLSGVIDPPDPQQWRLIGFVVRDRPAEPAQLIPVERGLSVLYGLNGAGKTRIIADVERSWRGHQSQAVALVQLPSVTGDYVDEFNEGKKADWFRDWAQRTRNDSGRPEEALLSWVSICIQSEPEYEGFPGPLDPDRDAKLHEEWKQHRLLLVEAVGTQERPEWISAPAVATGAERRQTNAAAALHELLDRNDDLDDYWAVSSLAPYALTPNDQTIMVGCVLGTPVLEMPQDIFSAGRHDQLMTFNPRLEMRVEDVDEASSLFLQNAVPHQFEVTDGEVGPSEALREVASELERVANRHYRGALQDAPVLRLRVQVVGLDAGVHWLVEDDDPRAHRGRELAGLSSAQVKWAKWSIAEAMVTLSQGLPIPRLILLDEPESALHRSAESHMAQYLSALATTGAVSLLVATHSPELLDLGHARLFEVTRIGGRRQVRRLPPLARESLETLGLLPSDLLRRQRGIILVDGLHDQLVLESLFGPELHALRTDVVPLRGTQQLSAAQIGFLFDFTPAHVFVMLDNLRTAALADIWEAAVREAQSGNLPGAVAHLDGAECLDGSSEGRVMRELLQHVVEAGNADRLTPHGLSHPDVIEYLPVGSLIGPGPGGTWAELRVQHARQRAEQKGTARDFKAWLRQRHGADFSPESLMRAVGTLDEIPADLLRLLKTVEARTSVQPPHNWH